MSLTLAADFAEVSIKKRPFSCAYLCASCKRVTREWVMHCYKEPDMNEG